MSDGHEKHRGVPGLWIGATPCFLVTGLALVQIQRKFLRGLSGW